MKLLKIDLTRIIRDRVGGKRGKLIPGFLLRGLERVIHQDELNEVLERTYPLEGWRFAEGVYDYFNVRLIAEGMENIPDEGRFIFASNHPLGGLDGIGLIALLGKKYGDENVRFLVNDMLMNVEPLRPVFLPINKYGSQGRGAAVTINEAYASGKQILIFPAGLCSRLGDDGKIRDLKWNKSFISKAIEYQRDIIPVHFIGENRKRFYRLARLRKKLGIKVNLEQAMLPAELCSARGKTFRVVFGKPISWESLASSNASHTDRAADIRRRIYDL